jgi:hypothetical protein
MNNVKVKVENKVVRAAAPDLDLDKTGTYTHSMPIESCMGHVQGAKDKGAAKGRDPCDQGMLSALRVMVRQPKAPTCNGPPPITTNAISSERGCNRSTGIASIEDLIRTRMQQKHRDRVN